MKRFLIIALLFSSALTGAVVAQTLVGVELASATALKMDSQVRLPHGSFRAMGQGVKPWIAKVRGGEAYGRWEVYLAKGVARRLQGAFVSQVQAGFAAAGYLLEGRRNYVLGREKHTSYTFGAAGGKRALLYVIETPEALVWLVGWSR